MLLAASLLTASILAVSAFGDEGAHSISSHFEIDTDGWTPGFQAELDHVSHGGNPGGYLLLIDDGSATNCVCPEAPPKFLGDLSRFHWGTLSIDVKLMQAPRFFSPNYGIVEITSGDRTVSRDLVPVDPDQTWRRFSAPLHGPAWGVSKSQWESILSNVTRISIRMEAGSWPDRSGLDNVTLAAPSVPTSHRSWSSVKARF